MKASQVWVSNVSAIVTLDNTLQDLVDGGTITVEQKREKIHNAVWPSRYPTLLKRKLEFDQHIDIGSR